MGIKFDNFVKKTERLVIIGNSKSATETHTPKIIVRHKHTGELQFCCLLCNTSINFPLHGLYYRVSYYLTCTCMMSLLPHRK